jgi:hypothetical protein
MHLSRQGWRGYRGGRNLESRKVNDFGGFLAYNRKQSASLQA